MKMVGQYDILLLQEIFLGHKIGRELHQELIEAAGLAGVRHKVIPRLPKLGQNTGLMILSRHQVLKTVERDWGSMREIFITKKGLLEADLDCSNDFAMSVFTLHLDAHTAEDRQKQLDELSVIVRAAQVRHDTGPRQSLPHFVIVAGDFNICPFTQPVEYQYLHRILSVHLELWEVFDDLQRQKTPQPNEEKEDENDLRSSMITCQDGRRIDYFWTNIPKPYLVSGQHGYLQTGNPDVPLISDHHALEVVFQLPFSSHPLPLLPSQLYESESDFIHLN